MFRLTAQELGEWNRSQFATGSQKHRDPRFPPYAFTEHGAVISASVLQRGSRPSIGAKPDRCDAASARDTRGSRKADGGRD